MNIAIIGALTGYGGIQKTAASLASELSDQNSVVFIDYRGDSEFIFPLPDEVKIFQTASSKNKGRLMNKGDNIYKIYTSEIKSIIEVLRKEQIDIAIFAASFCTALIPIFKSLMPEIKMIAWQHNCFEQYMGLYTEKYHIEYLSGVGCADIVVSVTKDDAERFKKYNKNSICIYNSVSLQNSKIYDINIKRFIFVGRIALEQKGLDLLLNAFDLVYNTEWQLNIVGSGEDDTLKELISKTRKCSQINIRGSKSGEELYHEFKSSSIFIMPSRWEGFGISMIEAMSFGLPVISTPTVGACEILCNGEYGLLTESFSPEDIANIMQKMIDNGELRRYFSEQSLKRARDFSVSKIIPLWNNVLYQIEASK